MPRMTAPVLAEPAVVSFLAEIKKNEREVIRCYLTEYHDRALADIRVYVPRRADGAYVPTPKGLTIDRALLPQLEEAVHALRLAAHVPAPTDAR